MNPNPDSIVIMCDIDRMPPPVRELVREYGYAIVRRMINVGYRNADTLRPILEEWRSQRQREWLASQFVTQKTMASIVDAAMSKCMR